MAPKEFDAELCAVAYDVHAANEAYKNLLNRELVWDTEKHILTSETKTPEQCALDWVERNYRTVHAMILVMSRILDCAETRLDGLSEYLPVVFSEIKSDALSANRDATIA